MQTLTDRIIPCFSESSVAPTGFQTPRFQIVERHTTIDLEVFVPGVSPDAIELAINEGHLVVTALRNRPVRMNWQAAGIEAVQRDYQLRAELGDHTDTSSIRAIYRDGILSIHLEKNVPLLPVEHSAA